ncbi:hypothetical protein AC579_28 [Pseudocercospora musae]|uniref:Uncharacterized protein n=1 Tax=Pseudocercospora musae TaxID=113226 RepID=A0A139GWN2_9PEZI|nr:hypothetical protein AC579_28 [Pseudocercospora musae]
MQLLDFVFLLSSVRVAFSLPETFVPYKNDLSWDDAMSQGLASVTFQYNEHGQPITLARWSSPDYIADGGNGLSIRDSPQIRDGPQKAALQLQCSWPEGIVLTSSPYASNNYYSV